MISHLAIMLFMTGASIETPAMLPLELDRFKVSSQTFLSALGLSKWSFWIQSVGEDLMCIHCFESENNATFQRIQTAF